VLGTARFRLPWSPSTRLPYDITAITDQLFIAAMPRAWHVEDIRGLGIDLILSMTLSPPPRFLSRKPYQLLRLPVVDYWLLPIPLSALRKGVEAALPVIEGGGQVLVHCRGGRHRSVVMAACILVALGMTAEQAMDAIVARRAVADPHARHIEPRIKAFERYWLQKVKASQG
jgi:hypothetical protein